MGKSWKDGRGKWDRFDKKKSKLNKGGGKKSKGGKPKEPESFEEQW
jgi:hypothetical protein